MALLYKNAKKEVDREYAELKAKGYTPKANNDGTYSWVNAEGDKYTGDLNPTGGRDAEASWAQQHFKRQARQDKIMSRKVSQELAMPGKKEDSKAGTEAPAGPKTGEEKLVSKANAPTPEAKEELIKPGEYVPKEFAPVTLPGLKTPEPKRATEVVEPTKPTTKPGTKESAYGRKIPHWGDEDAQHSRLVYVPEDEFKVSTSSFRKLQDENGGLGVRRGRGTGMFGMAPSISQSQVDWYNTVSDYAPTLPGSGMNRREDTYYPSTKVGEDGKKYILAFNPSHIKGRFDTEEAAKEFASRGWGRTRPIEKFGEEYGVGTNAWDYVQNVGGQLNSAANVVLAGLGLSPASASASASTITKAKDLPAKAWEAAINLVTKGKAVAKPVVKKAAEQALPTGRATEEAISKFGKNFSKPTQGSLFPEMGKVTTKVVEEAGPKLGPNVSPGHGNLVLDLFRGTDGKFGKIPFKPGATGPGYKCGGKLKPKSKGKGK